MSNVRRLDNYYEYQLLREFLVKEGSGKAERMLQELNRLDHINTSEYNLFKYELECRLLLKAFL